MSTWTTAFWKATADRALKSAAQTALVVIGGDQLVNAISVDWLDVGGFALGGALLSVLTSLGSGAVGGPGPSLTRAEKLNVTPKERDPNIRA